MNRGSFPGAQTCSGVSNSLGTGEGPPGTKWPDREADYVCIYSVKVKNLSTNMGIIGAHGDNYTFILC
jgi:hypothetical protein